MYVKPRHNILSSIEKLFMYQSTWTIKFTNSMRKHHLVYNNTDCSRDRAITSYIKPVS